MPRTAQLSPDNILRFLQVRRDPASADDIGAALHMRKADRHALYKMLSKLKKRRAIEELPGGRYRLASRRERGADGQPRQLWGRPGGSQPRSRGTSDHPPAAQEGTGAARARCARRRR